MKTQHPDTDRFQDLADRWERETAIFSNSSRAAQHPAHREIIKLTNNPRINPTGEALPLHPGGDRERNGQALRTRGAQNQARKPQAEG